MDDKYKEFIQQAQLNQRRLMEEASEVVMHRPVPGANPYSDRAAMIPEIKADGE